MGLAFHVELPDGSLVREIPSNMVIVWETRGGAEAAARDRGGKVKPILEASVKVEGNGATSNQDFARMAFDAAQAEIKKLILKIEHRVSIYTPAWRVVTAYTQLIENLERAHENLDI